jgi:N-acetylglucosaminyldiphosphoundecaprenol N-acetyl-beta-D-mannosaminyltransferase
MLDLGKRNVLGVMVDAIDFEAAVERIVEAASARRPYGVSALAVHGVMTGAIWREQRHRINALELATPDGQPVRWALNGLHRTRLRDRVHGPRLMLETCARAAREALPVFLYGSRPEVLEPLVRRLTREFPALRIAGVEPSVFGRTDAEGKREIVRRIRESGARLTFVGLGCPRQETFVYEYRDDLEMPVIAVGAAFDYHAGTLKELPEAMQRAGLQWIYRLLQDPRRLWRRYLAYNSGFAVLLLLQASRLWKPSPAGRAPTHEMRFA